jgi:hypothetical protein
MIAKNKIVARVIMLGAPADYSKELNMPAAWLSAPHATPTERYYGFAHIEDQGFKKIQQSWKLLGMAECGRIVTVDQKQPPYDHSHRLVTGVNPARRGKYHGSVATDETTPKRADGSPLFRSVWRYLFNLS